MKKELMLIGFVLMIITCSFFVSAVKTTSNLQINEETYDIELVLVESNSVILQVNDESRSLSPVQSSQPYVINPFSSSQPHIKFVIKDIIFQTFVGGREEATIWTGVEFNLSFSPVEDTTRELTIDRTNYTIEFIFIDNDEVSIIINDESSGKIYGTQNTPYYLKNYYRGNANMQGLDIVITDIMYSTRIGGILQATFLIGKDINFTLVDACENECFVLDEKTCENSDSYKICGEYDDDVCREWGNITDCGDDEECLNGICVDSPTPISTCENECVSGQKQCIDGNDYKVCGSYDEDECLEWSITLDCLPEQICENGTCVEKVSPSPRSSQECEPIGLIKNVKYCSLDNKWKNQKISKSSCENDFECKSNVCESGKCKWGEPSNKVYWIIFGIVLIVLVMLIIVFSKTKKY